MYGKVSKSIEMNKKVVKSTFKSNEKYPKTIEILYQIFVKIDE